MTLRGMLDSDIASGRIDIEEVTVEIARKHLPSWLSGSAILGLHRGMHEAVKKYDDLCTRAFKLLSDAEYTRIYNRTVKEYCR